MLCRRVAQIAGAAAIKKMEPAIKKMEPRFFKEINWTKNTNMSTLSPPTKTIAQELENNVLQNMSDRNSKLCQ
jgi:hypothetical protein